MSRMIRVELQRLLARRAVVVLLATTLLAPIAIALIVLSSTDAVNEEAAYAEALAEVARAASDPSVQADIDRCVDDPFAYGVVGGDDDTRALCEELFLPLPETYMQYSYDTLSLERELEGSGILVAVVVCLLAALAGATFVGHDWNTGSMSNQLLFRPGRLRTWFGKAIVVSAAFGLLAAVGTTLFWLTLAGRLSIADVPIADGVLLDGLQQGWRGAALAAVGAWIGYAVTMLSRSTVFTLGLLFAVALLGTLVAETLFGDPGWISPALNALAIVQDGATYYIDYDHCIADLRGSFEGCDTSRTRTLGQAVVYLGVLASALTAASALSFRRRDVP